MRANRVPARKARAGKVHVSVGDFGSDDQLTRLRAVRRSLAEAMADPETASKDRSPLARAFMEVDAKIVAVEESRKATASVTPITAAPSKQFDASRFV